MKKKIFKRAGVAVLSMAMLLSMGAMGSLSASAVGVAPVAAKTVTVANITKDDNTTDNNAKVGIYQVATRNIDGSWSWLDNMAPTVAVSGTQTPVVFGTAGANQISISSLSADQVHELAVWLQTNKATFTNKLENQNTGSAINLFSNADNQSVGYYLIVTTPGTGNSKTIQPTLASYDVQTTGSANADVTPKAGGITVDKSITAVTQSDGTNISEKNANSCMAEIGSTVSYSITTTTPSYAANVTPSTPFTIYDDPSDAIDIVANTVNMTVGGNDVIVNGVVQTGYTAYVTYTAPTTDGFSVAFSTDYLETAANQGQAVTVTFDATVGTDAVLGASASANTNTTMPAGATDKNANITGNPNTTYIHYSNNYSTGGDVTTKDDTVDTFVGKIVLGKYDNNGTNRLAGSKFMLTKQDTTDTSVWNNVTNAKVTAGVVLPTASGNFDLGYLAPGTYKLTETEAPAGYKVVAPFTFTVTGTSTSAYDTFVYNVTTVTNVSASGNNSGNTTITVNDPLADNLPGTGGMGTILFTVGGAAIVLLAGAMFVLYMKKRRVEE